MISFGAIFVWAAILFLASFVVAAIMNLIVRGSLKRKRTVLVVIFGLLLFWLSVFGYKSNGLENSESYILAAVLAGAATFLAFILSLIVGPSNKRSDQYKVF